DELIELSLPNGETKTIASSVVPLRDEAGRISGAVVVNDDVTALRRLERQLREREERLTLAQRAGGIGTFEWFVAENRIVWTPELEALYGLPPGGFEGRYEDWARRVHRDDLPAAEASLWGAVHGGPPYHAEFRIVRPDGSERWMLGAGDLYRDARGRPQRVLGVNIDITARKQTEAALDRYRLLAEHTADIVLFVRPDGRIVEANAAAVAAYGYDAATLRTLSVFDLREPSLLGDVPDQLLTANETGARFETVHRRKDGSSFPVEVGTLGAQIGGERLILSVIRDISDRKAAEAALAASRDELAAVLATVAHGIIVQAPDGHLLYGNTAAAQLMGFASGAELQTATPQALLAPYTVLDEAGTPVAPGRLPGQIAMRTGEPAEATLRYRAAGTGEERWSRVRAMPALAADGRVQFVVTALEEITGLKQAEERQRFLAELARSLVAAGTDLRGVLEATTRRIAAFLGDGCGIRLPSADGAFLDPIGFTHSDPAVAAFMDELLAGPNRIDEGIAGQVFRSGQAIYWPTVDPARLAAMLKPEYRPLLARTAVHSLIVAPLATAHGVAGTLGVVRTTPGRPYTPDDRALVQAVADSVALAIENARLAQETRDQLEVHVALNTALRESAAARDAALREAQEALRVRDEFLASVSHDLRTPLATLKGLAQLLHRRATRGPTVESEMVAHQTETMERSVERMARLVDDLLDLARLESGRVLELALEPLELVALARRVALEHQRTAPYHRIVMETDTEALNGVWDGGRLERVLTNLIGNAVKYSPQGGTITVRLTSSADDAGSWAELAVADSGIGIPAEDLPRVTERFFRASNAGVVKGTGIGLATVRQIVEQHGGSIAIRSAEGAGTTVTVRLPLEARAPGTATGGQ
ncbi:MAG TPA: PAS domain S-box protein, partial [Dehalococcoidia bacterium]|nr:PAS domain S-box protein [Dehalococcoidia bacterium]